MRSIINNISHITFICQDLNKTSIFLQRVFGAVEIYSSNDKKFSVAREKFFKIGELWLAIMEGESIGKTYNHIAFFVEAKELPRLRDEIIQLGLEVLEGRPRHDEEGASLYFYDYDNHLFELHSGSLEQRLQFYTKK